MSFSEAFWWYLLVIAVLPAAIFGLIFIIAGAIYLRDSLRLHRLMKDLEMDQIAIAQRASARDLAGLLEDIAAKLREKSELLCYRTERMAQELIADQAPGGPTDGHTIAVLVDELRHMLANAGPRDIWFLDVTAHVFQSPAVRKRYAEHLSEWESLLKQGALFGAYIRRYGIAIDRYEAKRRGTP